MQQGTYKQEISDIQEDSPIYSSGFRNDTGVEVFGSQTLTNSTTYGAVNTVSGSKSYAYENLLPYHIVMILEYLAILQQVWDLVQQKQWRKDGQKKKAKAKH